MLREAAQIVDRVLARVRPVLIDELEAEAGAAESGAALCPEDEDRVAAWLARKRQRDSERPKQGTRCRSTRQKRKTQ